jgi:hypothetical protein
MITPHIWWPHRVPKYMYFHQIQYPMKKQSFMTACHDSKYVQCSLSTAIDEPSEMLAFNTRAAHCTSRTRPATQNPKLKSTHDHLVLSMGARCHRKLLLIISSCLIVPSSRPTAAQSFINSRNALLYPLHSIPFHKILTR